MAPIVTSLLENELTVFRTWQLLLHRHPGAHGAWRLVWDGEPAFPPASLASALSEEIDHLCTLQFTAPELDYLRDIPGMSGDFVDFLSVFRFQSRFVLIDASGDRLHIEVAGPMIQVCAFGTVLDAILSELYLRRMVPDGRDPYESARWRLRSKLQQLGQLDATAVRFHPFRFYDRALRCRFSSHWQNELVQTLVREAPRYFAGTTNVHLARRHGTRPLGGMGHDVLQAYQALAPLRRFQQTALRDWIAEYPDAPGEAVTDTVGSDAFLAAFDKSMALGFGGVCHASGDAFAWGEQMLANYRRLGIDPRTRVLEFGGDTDLGTAISLHQYFGDGVGTRFGLGPSLGCDVGLPAPACSMGMVACEGQAVAVLSDAAASGSAGDACHAWLRSLFCG